MRKYITIGADARGEVYGLELNDDTWRRNPLGLSTSCVVIRPISKSDYIDITTNPENARELWHQAVTDGHTDLGLKAWFKEVYLADERFGPIDKSFVYELLDDPENPTVAAFPGGRFRQALRKTLVESDKVEDIDDPNEVYEWEASGCFPPTEPFAVELAPKELLEEYYQHLRETSKEFKMPMPHSR